ncbi:DUF1203 domain-containing protein [Microvirga subterranea]|uniref:Uncharacterized protein DUF1203 n=1 Tax=Microvirga subterranea TaxID=186651 RepID=A0A370HQU4_9HYPH|nr:DUF1203 domain-containing protein [Microvirga subterranea]RDI60919.1 uncharacterized protein DUF1203 [Microvirga subterranea]
MSFQVRGIDPQPFQPLFDLSDEALAAKGIIRVVADEPDAYPCRVALERVRVGEELLLVHYMHQPNPASPYRAAGPIFVSRAAAESAHYRGELPPSFRDRLLSLRAYDSKALIVDAEVADGDREVLSVIERFLSRPDVAHVDVHFARRGCFAGRVERA